MNLPGSSMRRAATLLSPEAARGSWRHLMVSHTRLDSSLADLRRTRAEVAGALTHTTVPSIAAHPRPRRFLPVRRRKWPRWARQSAFPRHVANLTATEAHRPREAVDGAVPRLGAEQAQALEVRVGADLAHRPRRNLLPAAAPPCTLAGDMRGFFPRALLFFVEKIIGVIQLVDSRARFLPPDHGSHLAACMGALRLVDAVRRTCPHQSFTEGTRGVLRIRTAAAAPAFSTAARAPRRRW